MLNITNTVKRTAVLEAFSAPVREIKNRVTFGHYEFRTDPNGMLGSRTEYGNLVSFTPKGGGISAITEIPLSDKGYDSIDITRCGKNLINIPAQRIKHIKGFTFTHLEKGTYSFTYEATSTYNDQKILVWFADENEKEITELLFTKGTLETISFDRKLPIKTINFYAGKNYATSKGYILNTKKVMLEKVGDSWSTPYEPYKGNTYTVNFPQKIYKGTYNWATGELNGFIGYPDLKPFKTTLSPQNIPALSGLNNVFSSNGTTRVTYSINASKRTFVGDKTIETMSARINQDGNGNPDGIAIGNSCVSSASCEFRNDDTKFLYSNKYAFFESGVKLKDGTFEFIPLGYFGCGKAETTNEGKTYKIDGYDDIYLMSRPWSPNTAITESTTYLSLVEDIANRYGLELEYESVSVKNKLGSYKLISPNVIAKYTDREVLGFCAGAVGCNARMTTEGKLRVAWFGSNTEYIIEPTVQWQEGFNKIDDVPFTLESVTSGVDETVYTMGTGTGIEYANPLVNAEKLKDVYNKIVVTQKAQWQPSSCTWRGNPCVQAGDTVVIKDRVGKRHQIYIANQELELAGGLISRIECHSNEDKISFSTFEKDPGASLNKVYNDMHEAIAEATAMINGARGGYFRVLEKSNQPYGWECFNTNGLEGVRCTYGGIGCTADGGRTYKSAMTGRGFVGDAITIGRINGANERFFLDLETGETSFSDITVTGGSIEMDGGTIKTSSSNSSLDLSPGFAKLSYPVDGNWSGLGGREGMQLRMMALGSPAPPNLFVPQGGWYATLAANEEIGGSEETRLRGIRLASNFKDIFWDKSGVDHNSVLWENTYATFENDSNNFRENLYINRKRTDKFAGVVCHRNHRFSEDSSLTPEENLHKQTWDARFGAGVVANQNTAMIEVNRYKLFNSNEISSSPVRADFYSSTLGKNAIMRMESNGVSLGSIKFEANKPWFWDGSRWREIWLK